MLAPEPAYEGACGRTRRERRSYACRCGVRFTVELVRSVDAASDPELARRLLDGAANRARCAHCRTDEPVGVSVVYHDPERALLVLLIPDSMRHRELEERGRLYLALAEDGVAAPRYVRELRVAIGLGELQSIVGAPPSPAEPVTDPRQEMPDDGHAGVHEAGSASTPVPQVPPVAQTPVQLVASALVEPPTAPVFALRSPVRMSHAAASVAGNEGGGQRAAVTDARAAAIDRWSTNREPATTIVHEDEVIHLVALPRAESAPFVEGPLELRVQLHRMPGYPLVALTLLSPTTSGRARALHALLEIGRAAHRVVLERLARRASVTVEIFTPEYLPLARHQASAPLEKNVARLFTAAKEALKRIPSAQRDFEAARRAFLATDYDRLGRVEPDFEAARGPLDGPRAVRRAVAEISRWSEAAAEAYLIEIRSLPVASWIELRSAVVRRALELGVHARRTIVERMLGEAQVTVAWPDVLRRQVQAFATLIAGRHGNDLQAEEELENWRLLFGECKAAGVVIDPEVRALAASRSHRPPARDDEPTVESPPTFDPVRATTGELIALLERRELRRDVALALCERHDPAALVPLFQSLPKMTRAEANRALPSMVAAYGDATVPLLIEGLRGRKSYLRQGCALGLGALGRPQAIEPLLELLRSEPTEVWREVARALGDLGAMVVPAIGQRLRTPGVGDLEETRERLVRALAHVAGRGDREAVERLTSSPDPQIAEPARKALALLDEVRRADREVRVEAPRDQTVVRAFSRRFFEALGEDAELAELEPQELVEAGAHGEDSTEEAEDAETLDESDLVEEPAVSRSDSTQPRLVLPRNRGT